MVRTVGRRTINAFEMRCWRRMLRVSWTDRRTNALIMEQIGATLPLEAMIVVSQHTYTLEKRIWVPIAFSVALIMCMYSVQMISDFYGLDLGGSPLCASYSEQWESLVLVLMYLVYIVIMKFNYRARRYFDHRKKSIINMTSGTANNTDIDDSSNCDATVVLLKKANFHSKASVLMVDELLSAYPHQLSFSDAGLRIMITSHFPPRTRLTMASRLLITEVTVIGYTLGIPDVIMGITFLAAGTSVPDCMASLIVARQGRVQIRILAVYSHRSSLGIPGGGVALALALPRVSFQNVL
ncbi:UNVERIFIED_CONTAM: hypothetical protein FKN15_028050 [Acipenser sinensis]